MAGEIPRKSTSGRKQWILQGDQRGSLKRLRNQLASDGCPESQVVLAKQLLNEESEFQSEQRENARSGVYWLIKASQQGNVEATNLLRTCFQSGKGINEHNYMDVKSCITMTQDEKIVRKAAKEIFASLSNGGDYITSNQLQKKILAIDRGQGCSKSTETSDLDGECDCSGDNGYISKDLEDLSGSEDEDTDWSEKSLLHNEKLTEDKIVSAAITFSCGSLPVVNNSLCLIEPDLRALDHIPLVYWSILHPILSLQIFYFKLIKYLGSISFPLPLAKTNIQLLLLLFAYLIFSSVDLTHLLYTFMFYASFIVMVVTTIQMLQIQREIHEFRLWRGLFICYSNRDLNEYSFETQFIISHIKPYAWYFFSLLLHYFCYSLTSSKLESEFTVISCFLMFVTLFGFMRTYRSKTVIDYLMLLSFAINILARYPYDTDPIVFKGWRYLELNVPTFPNYIVGNGIEFCINFRILLYMLIPLLFIRMASREKWRGSYKILLPHLVTLSWLQYFALCSQHATTYGLYRATLALVGSVLFLPLVSLTSVILPVAALTKWIIASNFIYAFCLFLFLLSISLTVCYICAQTRFARYTAILQVLLMLIAFFSLINSEYANIQNYQVAKETKTLKWESFQRLCYNRLWYESENTIGAQLACAELEGTEVSWEGTIKSVKIWSISNFYKKIFDKFPKFISNYLYCLYGVRIKNECDHNDAAEIGDCLILNEIRTDQCTLKNHNVYTYEITLKMVAAYWNIVPKVYLHLDHEFTNFTLNLRMNDYIKFKGTLYNNGDDNIANDILGSSLNVHIKVDEISCVSCSNTLSSHKIQQVNYFFGSELLYHISHGFKFVLNVMFNPVLMFS